MQRLYLLRRTHYGRSNGQDYHSPEDGFCQVSLSHAGIVRRADLGLVSASTRRVGAGKHSGVRKRSGVDYTHPDLAANLWSNPGSIGGCSAGTHGYNAISDTCDPKDDNNHGTHVSGTIGAVGNNALGVVGVNWKTQISPMLIR